ASVADARVVRLRIERREQVLKGRPFGAAGPYEKLIGRVDFGLDPSLPRNGDIVDLRLAPRNARGEVESSADFYMLKPVDPRRGNGRLFYEVGNRGGKAMLATFQRATGSADPTTDAEYGDSAMMRQGFTLLWMGWQWDVPERPGTMRMEMPIATEDGRRITGVGRGSQPQGVSGPRCRQRRARDDRARRSGREGSGDSTIAVALRRRRNRGARRRLRARAHLRRRLSQRGSTRRRVRAGGHARS